MASSKHAWAGIGLSLIASTASASIPDANGVIHGCYNALTGSTRIIDGNSCGLLEKAVTWSQTGPRGPAGASVTGASLPINDPNCPAGGVALSLSGTTSYICNGLPASQDLEIGRGMFRIQGPIAPHSQVVQYVGGDAYFPKKYGLCVYNISSRFFDPVPGVTYSPYLQTNGGQGTIGLLDGTGIYHQNGTAWAQASSTAAWGVDPNLSPDYRIGIMINTGDYEVPRNGLAALDFLITWVCNSGASPE